MLIDLKSVNGVELKGRWVKVALLEHGDVFRLAGEPIRFIEISKASEKAPRPPVLPRHLEFLTRIHAIVRRMQGSFQIDPIIDHLLMFLKVDRGEILSLSKEYPDGFPLSRRPQVAGAEEDIDPAHRRIRRHFCRLATTSGQALICPDTMTDPRIAGRFMVTRRVAILVVPLWIRSTATRNHILYLEHDLDRADEGVGRRLFDESDLKIVLSVAGAIRSFTGRLANHQSRVPRVDDVLA